VEIKLAAMPVMFTDKKKQPSLLEQARGRVLVEKNESPERELF